MPGLAHNCRWHRIREGTVSSFAFAYLGAKVRISEQNAKGKFVFLFIFEREYLRCSQRYSKEEHYPVAAPTLVETIKLRMYEMGLTQTKLAEMLGLSTARISEIITGKGEPSLKTGREISRKLNIDPAIVLGV
ncbi:MAG: helix-turn-helix transcriptional regulator [Prevotella sp.]|nr:helix-turn-helix transcriptional regulator [Prevotella sp.]MBO5624362.1 helix-turn-helix transcriptional regulator [Prevotella sp.]